MKPFFAKLTPATARWQTLVGRHAGGLALEAGGRRWRFEPSAPGPGPFGATLYATWGAAEIAVWLGDWRVAASAALGAPPETAGRLPEPLARAALECFAADGLSALERASGLPAELVRLDREPASPLASACHARLRRDDGLVLPLAWTAADPDGAWRAALERALAARDPPPSDLPDRLPLPGAVALGAWPWDARELAWEPGDVLWPPDSVEAGALRTLTVGRALRFAARQGEGILRVEGRTMTAVPAPDAPLDAVEVDLTAEVGRLTVTLAQLRRLGEGQVVEFSTPVETPVSLTVGGLRVAQGELVDAGGRVGVRVTALVPAPAGDPSRP